MAKKFIPQVGEQYTGPFVKKLVHVTYGPDTTADVLVTDCGTYTLIDVNEPIIVFSAKVWIATAFTASTTPCPEKPASRCTLSACAAGTASVARAISSSRCSP